MVSFGAQGGDGHRLCRYHLVVLVREMSASGYCRLGLGMGNGTPAGGEDEGGGGIQVGMYSSWGENQGGGVCCDAPAAVDASGTISAGSVVPRRTGVSRGASGKIQIHATYKAEAATPRTKRSVTLRATDRGGERRVRETLGSTTAMTGSE
jgi:hypothetical protein